ncbi:toll-like receptor 13 [Pseudophryne corroboree]|uniref:toll-like receptor 13 n=1 Tax=Pseudophryne corroboree TaxID=495146 RepID=UPI00308157BD
MVLLTKMIFIQLTLLILLSSIKQGDGYAIRGCEVHNLDQPKVLCYKMDLDHVPEQLPPKTVILDISFNRIEVIKAADFSNVCYMVELNISTNIIQVIEMGSFQKLSRLELLNLSNNKLESLSAGIFEGLQNLSTLLLDNNGIVIIQPMAFSALGNLRVLGLSSNPLRTLKILGTIFQLHSLEEIYIGNCSLVLFSSSDIENISTSLHIIDASKNAFSAINFTTQILENLTSLDISFCGPPVVWTIQDPCFLKGLKRLFMEGIKLKPPAVSQVIHSLSCSSLEEISLGHLNLADSDHIIQEICLKHPNIQTLHLQGNDYTRFTSNTFQNCTSLKNLDLSHNTFVHVPRETFSHLSSLKQLTLANNKLTALPDDLSQMTILERLNLSSNQLTTVYLNDTKSYSQLKYLDLSENKIFFFHSSSPITWSLQYLNLGQNYLFDISESFAANLRNLQDLILRTNKLSSITANTFKNLTFLKALNLIDNQIEIIYPGAFEGVENLQTLLLGSNKITRNDLQSNTFRGLKSLVELQLFRNYIEYESSKKLDVPPFQILKSLKLLTLNSQGHNGMRNLPVNIFEGLVALNKVLIGNLALSEIDKNVLLYIPQLKELDLSNNPIQTLHKSLLEPVCNLTELHLNRMKLETLDFINSLNFSKLVVLRAAGNELSTFTDKQHQALPSLKFLDLRSNPLYCSCDNQWFLNWVQSDVKTQVLYFYDFQCAYPPSKREQKFSTFNTDSCRPNYDFILFVSTSVCISILLVSLTVWKFLSRQIVHYYYMLQGYLYDRKYKGKKQEHQFDAFISYNCSDEEWVFSQLVPNLEETNNWKLCLHHRDFEPGKAIVDNIVDSIYSSRKTICVISRHYLASEWCSKEMQVASYRLFDEHADVLILLFLEKIPNHRLSPYHQMRRLLKEKTYLIWPKDGNDLTAFWNMVNQALQDD